MTTLSIDAYLAAIAGSGSRLGDFAEAAGLDAPVPTCPAWDVGKLVAHQAMVHRWAAAHVRRDPDRDRPVSQTEIRTSQPDLLGYYRDGLRALLDALEAAPDDLEAMTFVNDAPRPRLFWARRQTHETTIHMADALAASLGRAPTTADATIDPELARDGIDELLVGFFTRGPSKLYDGTDFTIAVTPTDGDPAKDAAWVMEVSERATVHRIDAGAAADAGADATLSGTAAGLYLGLWNRGDEVTATGHRDVIDRWREVHTIRWG